MNIKEWAFIILVISAVFAFQYIEIKDLKSTNETLKTTVSQQATKIDNLNTSVEGIVRDDNNRVSNAVARDKSNSKIEKDTKAEATFAKKPGLLENMINSSFDKFANQIVGNSK